MKNIIKSSLLISGICLTLVSYGQQMEKKTPEERAKMQTAWMQKNLVLTPEQNDKSYSIILRYAQFVQNANLDAAPETQRAGLMNSRDNELKGVLTASQFEKFRAHELEMREKMQARKAGKGQ